jgi:hypothetical protein
LHAVKVTDPEALKGLIARIRAIPENGKLMVKMGPDASYIEMKFHCEGEVRRLEIYNGKLKTPSTGFNVDPGADEKAVVNEVLALLKAKK